MLKRFFIIMALGVAIFGQIAMMQIVNAMEVKKSTPNKDMVWYIFPSTAAPETAPLTLPTWAAMSMTIELDLYYKYLGKKLLLIPYIFYTHKSRAKEEKENNNYFIDNSFIILIAMAELEENKIRAKLTNFLYDKINTPLQLELLARTSKTLELWSLVGLFQDLSRHSQSMHPQAFRSFIAFLTPPLNHELTLSPHVHTIDRQPNKFMLSLSANKRKFSLIASSEEFTDALDSSDTTETSNLIRDNKKFIGQENDETESNQDTNGTTGPRKENLKNVPTIEPSSISIGLKLSTPQELSNDTKKLNLQKLTASFCNFSFENLEYLFGSDGTCNNAPNTEVSKEESNGDEPDLFLVYDSITYHTHKPKKGSMNKRLAQKKIELEEDK